jgi:hypothetical protein
VEVGNSGSVLDVEMAMYLKDFPVSTTTAYERHTVEYLHLETTTGK